MASAASASSTRRFLVGGNWKMNGSRASMRELIAAWDAAVVSPVVGRFEAIMRV